MTDATPVHLSVVIPAYNEEKRLTELLPILLKYLATQNYSWEIIIVDDGSRDGTSRLCAELTNGLPCTILRNDPNRGKGGAIKRGMLEAKGKYRLFSDADFSTPIEELASFWPFIQEGYAVVIGSRDLPESRLEVRQEGFREFMGRTFNALVQTLLVKGINDTQCGFKLFTAEAADAIFPKQTLSGFAFDVELLILARKMGFRIKEAPVKWVNSPASTVSKWRGFLAFVDLFRLKLRK